MTTGNDVTMFEDFDDDDASPRHRQLDTRRPYGRMTRKMVADAARFKQAQAEVQADFKFTYEPARFEEWWLLASLGELYEHQWIQDVFQRVRSGKEASVYQCAGGPAAQGALTAAKVYRPWSLRNMRNDWLYREGRLDLDNEGHEVIDGGMLHAIAKRTEYGRQLLHESWIAYEFKTMRALHSAGADIPEPYVMTPNTILMGFVGDRHRAAPTLNEVPLGLEEARSLFDRVLRNLHLLLSGDRIHGDLSAYNILYWQGRISLIDFPQVVSPRDNPNSYLIFRRDVQRLCDYFGRQGLDQDSERLSLDLWTSHGLPLRDHPMEE